MDMAGAVAGCAANFQLRLSSPRLTLETKAPETPGWLWGSDLVPGNKLTGGQCKQRPFLFTEGMRRECEAGSLSKTKQQGFLEASWLTFGQELASPFQKSRETWPKSLSMTGIWSQLLWTCLLDKDKSVSRRSDAHFQETKRNMSLSRHLWLLGAAKVGQLGVVPSQFWELS